jgi:hypothetical protein
MTTLVGYHVPPGSVKRKMRAPRRHLPTEVRASCGGCIKHLPKPTLA